VEGAAQWGLALEALLAFISELVARPEQPTVRDQQRSRPIERLLARYRPGSLMEEDRAEMNRLIDTDYREAIARADRLIKAKECNLSSPGSAPASAQPSRSVAAALPGR
jgi:hypothetical protein